MKTYYIKNLGCSKNKTDGSAIEAMLVGKGYCKAKDPEQASIIVVNTCGFIQSARQQSIDAFFELNSLKRKGARIILAGCLAQMFHDEISEELKEADAIVGNFNLSEFSELLDSYEDVGDSSRTSTKRVIGIGKQSGSGVRSRFDVHMQPDVILAPVGDSPVSAYLKIAEGCNHMCSFCAIPGIRGRFRSFDKGLILKSIRQAVDSGTHEINMIAQDLLSYGSDFDGASAQIGFVGLLSEIAGMEGDFVVRCLYMHPDSFNMDVVRFMGDHRDRFLPYFDLAFQHGSDRILSLMNRKHSSSYYAKMVDDIRKVLPDSVIRSTFMLGFPGETKTTIRELRSFLGDVQLEYCGFFRYSKEDGTRAAGLKPTYLSGKLIDEEIESIKALCDESSSLRLSRFCGREFPFIVEEDAGDGVFLGRLPFQAPEVDGICEADFSNWCSGAADVKSVRVGDVVRVRTAECVNDYDFVAHPIGT